VLQDLPILSDDELLTPPVGKWAVRKYKLVRYYSSLFATAMRDKWDCRVYIDLFAGAGRARIADTNTIHPASPMLALDVPHPFDKYIFCDIDAERLEVLQERVTTAFPGVDAAFILGDCNASIEDIMREVPAPGKALKVLSFCFVDPYRMGNLSFATMETLSRLYVDFLVLIPAYMDAHRNQPKYIKPKNVRIERFLGLPEWRQLWADEQSPSYRFGSFVVDQFGRQMTRLGYRYTGLKDTIEVRRQPKGLALYRLAFFSRHPLGLKLWKQALRYTDEQMTLFDLD
jgi:three-Cys-motif partner protein